jgi:hypothetical protein
VAQIQALEIVPFFLSELTYASLMILLINFVITITLTLIIIFVLTTFLILIVRIIAVVLVTMQRLGLLAILDLLID